MPETINFNITKVQIASGSYIKSGIFDYDWYAPYAKRVYAGREGMEQGGQYYMTLIEFSAEDQNFLSASSLKLTMKTAREGESKSNVGRISAILCDKELTSSQVYFLQSESDLEKIDDNIAYANCENYPNLSDSALPNVEVNFVFDEEDISWLGAGKKYYLYLKRRIGLVNKANTSGEGGWSEFYDPYEFSKVELEYNGEPDWPLKDEVEIDPSTLNLIAGEETIQKFILRGKQSKEAIAHESLEWYCKVFDESGELLEQEGLVTQTGLGEFTFSANLQPKYIIQIIAKIGYGVSAYEVILTAQVFERWPHLETWIIGYNLGLLSWPVVNVVRLIDGYTYILNQADNTTVSLPVMPEYLADLYVCIAQNELIPTMFELYTSDKPFIYNEEEKRAYITPGAVVQQSVCRPNKVFAWSEFVSVEKTEEIICKTIWSNEDLVNENGVVCFNTYIPAPFYNQGV